MGDLAFLIAFMFIRHFRWHTVEAGPSTFSEKGAGIRLSGHFRRLSKLCGSSTRFN